MLSRVGTLKQIDKIKIRQMAERLRFCRVLVGKTLREFAETSDLSYSTLSRYERALAAVSKKNMDRLVNLFLSQDIIFTREWLMEGIGDLPTLREKMQKQEPSLEQDIELKQIEADSMLLGDKDDIEEAFVNLNEINFIRRSITGCVIRYIEDNSMFPIFKVGECVVGSKIDQKDMEKINGEYCIVLLENKKMVIRQFFTKDGITSLICVNVSEYPHPVYIQGYPEMVAPIVYHRKFLNLN